MRAHDRHFTYGENFGAPDCLMPPAGIVWRKTRMPVVPELWPARPEAVTASSPWSTVMTWNVFKGKLEHGGVEYRGKAEEFAKIADLPRHFARPFRVAVGGTEAPLDALAAHGWRAEDGPSATLTPADYQDYIAGSRGEVSVAKNVYVALKTGWFSTRSACYLAAGATYVVVQDTGFSRILPTGRGLHAFSTADEAAAAIAAVEANCRSQEPAPPAMWRWRISTPATCWRGSSRTRSRGVICVLRDACPIGAPQDDDVQADGRKKSRNPESLT